MTSNLICAVLLLCIYHFGRMIFLEHQKAIMGNLCDDSTVNIKLDNPKMFFEATTPKNKCVQTKRDFVNFPPIVWRECHVQTNVV